MCHSIVEVTTTWVHALATHHSSQTAFSLCPDEHCTLWTGARADTYYHNQVLQYELQWTPNAAKPSCVDGIAVANMEVHDCTHCIWPHIVWLCKLWGLYSVLVWVQTVVVNCFATYVRTCLPCVEGCSKLVTTSTMMCFIPHLVFYARSVTECT